MSLRENGEHWATSESLELLEDISIEISIYKLYMKTLVDYKAMFTCSTKHITKEDGSHRVLMKSSSTKKDGRGTMHAKATSSFQSQVALYGNESFTFPPEQSSTMSRVLITGLTTGYI